MKRLFLCALLITSCGTLFSMQDAEIAPAGENLLENRKENTTWKKARRYGLDFASGYTQGAAMMLCLTSLPVFAHDGNGLRKAILLPGVSAVGLGLGVEGYFSTLARLQKENDSRMAPFAVGYGVGWMTMLFLSTSSLINVLDQICDDDSSD